MRSILLSLLFVFICSGVSVADTEITSLPYTCSSADTRYYLSSNFTVTSGTSDLIVISANNVTLDGQGYTITRSSGSAISNGMVYITGNGAIVEDLNLITTAGSAQARGIRRSTGTGTTTIRNCTVVINSLVWSAVSLTTGTNNLENVLAYCAGSSACGFDSGTNGSAIGCTFITAYSSGYALYLGNTSSNTVSVRNCIMQSTNYSPFYCASDTWSGLSHSNNNYYENGTGTTCAKYLGVLYTSDTITTFEPTGTALIPNFTSATDYNLTASSICCINTGDSTYVTTLLDVGGDDRVQSDNVDKGAYESSYSTPTYGACCDYIGGCTITIEVDCSYTWSGSGTVCDPNTCVDLSDSWIVSNHPRLLIHSDSLTVWKNRLLGNTTSGMYEAWRDRFNTYCTSSARGADSTRQHCVAWSMLWHITGESAYKTRVIDELRLYNRTRMVSGWNDANLTERYGFGRMHPMVYAYDMMYDELDTVSRDSLKIGILNYLKGLTDMSSVIYHRAQDFRFAPAIALLNDTTSTENDYIKNIIIDTISFWETKGFACMDEVASGGTEPYYEGVYAINHMMLVEALKYGIGYNGSMLTSSYYLHMPDFWIHNMLPGWRLARLSGRYNNSEIYTGAYYSYFAARQGSLEAQKMAIDTDLTSVYVSSPTYNTLNMAWFNSSLASVDYSSFRNQFTDTGSGYYFWRSGWNMDATNSDDITVHFYNGPDIHPDFPRNTNELTVTRGLTGLLVTAAKFKDESDQHFTYYGKRSGSRNVALIYDPSESLTPNDGGQKASNFSSENWPACNYVGLRGSADTLSTSSGLLWGVTGDATLAYNTAKADNVKREVRIPVSDWIFVQDWINPTFADSFDCAVSWHTIEKPTLDIAWGDTLVGNAYGGVYKTSGADVVHVNRTGSYFTSRANLYPYANGGSPELVLVGGNNVSNEPWKQNKVAGYSTYVADPANVSYECWVGYPLASGSNYGPYSSFNISDINSEENACGSWRLEYTVADAPSSLLVATAIQVGADTISTKTVSWADTSNMIQCRIRGSGTNMVVCMNHLSSSPINEVSIPIMGSVFTCLPSTSVNAYVYGLEPGEYFIKRGETTHSYFTITNDVATFDADVAGVYDISLRNATGEYVLGNWTVENYGPSSGGVIWGGWSGSTKSIISEGYNGIRYMAIVSDSTGSYVIGSVETTSSPSDTLAYSADLDANLHSIPGFSALTRYTVREYRGIYKYVYSVTSSAAGVLAFTPKTVGATFTIGTWLAPGSGTYNPRPQWWR